MRTARIRNAVAAAWRPALPDVLAGLFFAVLASILVWPSLRNPTGAILGPGGDVIGSLALLRESLAALGESHTGPISGLAYPEGLPIPFAQYLATWPSTGLQAVLFLAIGPEFGLNLFVFGGLLLNGAVTYGFIRWLTGSWWAGVVSGMALMVSPAVLFNVQTAPDFAQLWPLVALIWAATAFARQPTVGRGWLAGSLAAVCIAWNPYWLLMGTVATVWLVGYALFQSVRSSGKWPRPSSITALLGPIVVTYVGFAALLLLGGQSSLRQRDLQEFYVYSARPFEYLRPPPTSMVPELGLPGIRYESGTYFYVSLLLAGFAIVAVTLAIRGRLPEPAAESVLSIGVLGLIAGVFSMPPTADVGGMTVYFPSWFIAQVTTTWRIYGRFGLVVLVAVVLMAGIGLASSLPLLKSNAVRAFAGIAVAILVWLDFGPALPLVGTPVDVEPGVYRLLASQPAGALAEYPLQPSYAGNYEQLYRRKWHGRPLLNGYTHDSAQERRALAIARLSSTTAATLRRLGIRFVVLDRLTADSLAGTSYAPGVPSRAFIRVGQDSRFTLYRVSADPPPARPPTATGRRLLSEVGRTSA